MSFRLSKEIQFDECRCYTYEPNGVMKPSCPWCAKKSLAEAYEEMKRLQLTIYGLRGRITKLKRKKP
jgi:hypothetical protein